MLSGHFRAVLFYSPELSHESTKKPQFESHKLWTLSPSEGTVETRRGTEGALVLANCNFGPLWSLAGLTWAWLFQLLLAAKLLGYSKSQPLSLTRQEESRGQPNRWDSGSFHTFLEASQQWLGQFHSTPLRKQVGSRRKKRWNCLRRKWAFHGQFLVENGKNSK